MRRQVRNGKLRTLEAEGVSKIARLIDVRAALRAGAQWKRGKKMASATYQRMKGNHEFLIEGQIPPYDWPNKSLGH